MIFTTMKKHFELKVLKIKEGKVYFKINKQTSFVKEVIKNFKFHKFENKFYVASKVAPYYDLSEHHTFFLRGSEKSFDDEVLKASLDEYKTLLKFEKYVNEKLIVDIF